MTCPESVDYVFVKVVQYRFFVSVYQLSFLLYLLYISLGVLVRFCNFSHVRINHLYKKKHNSNTTQLSISTFIQQQIKYIKALYNAQKGLKKSDSPRIMVVTVLEKISPEKKFTMRAQPEYFCEVLCVAYRVKLRRFQTEDLIIIT